MAIRIIVLYFFIGISVTVKGQECGTPNNTNPQHFDEENQTFFSKSTPQGICIDVFFHIVRETDGTGGFDPAQINDIVDNLNQAYNSHRIYINNIGVNIINNSTFFDLSPTIQNNHVVTPLFNNGVNNAINIFLVNTLTMNGDPMNGAAQAIESTNFIVINGRALTSTSPHELGHCLNLFHTFQGTAANTSGCAENIISSKPNCWDCGDRVCDTPADANTGNLGGYSPDLTNIMSYYVNREHLTEGQGSRMRAALNNSSVLQSVLGTNCTVPDLIGPSSFCYSTNGTTFSLQNGGTPVSWNVSSNLQILSSSNTSISVRPINTSTRGQGFIEAILPFETIREDMYIGAPTLNYSIQEDFMMCRDINTTENNSFSVQIAGEDGSTSWEVQRITNNHWPTMQGNEVWVSLDYTPPYDHIAFKVRATNNCGYSPWLEYYVEVIDYCGMGGSRNYIVHPNPANEVLTVAKKLESDLKNTLGKKKPDSYKLFDFDGNLILESNLSDRTDILVSELPKGRYILKILMGKREESHHIIIE